MWSLIDNFAHLDCPVPCQNIEYHTKLSRQGTNSMANRGFENSTLMYARYASSKIKIEEEYTIMGVTAIISATGGSLGLFLGLSCYGVAWKVLEMAQSAYNFILA